MKFLTRLKARIGERRIDVAVKRHGDEPSAIDEIALHEDVAL